MRSQWIRGAFLAATSAAVLAWIVTINNVAPPARRRPRRADKYASVLLKEVPHVEQKPDFCGEACTEMWLRHLGYKVDQNDVFDVSSLDPALGHGCYPTRLATALKNLELQDRASLDAIRQRQSRRVGKSLEGIARRSGGRRAQHRLHAL